MDVICLVVLFIKNLKTEVPLERCWLPSGKARSRVLDSSVHIYGK